MTREEKILQMQEPSTRKALSQSKEERTKHILSPVPKESQCVKEDGTVDLNVRPLTAQEASAYNNLRYERGEWIAAMREEEGRTLTEEKKERAVHAFMTLRTFAMVRDKFKELMGKMFKPSHAEIVAEEMKKRNET